MIKRLHFKRGGNPKYFPRFRNKKFMPSHKKDAHKLREKIAALQKTTTRPTWYMFVKLGGIKQWILRFGDKNLGEFLLPRFKVLLHINSNGAVIKSFCVILSPGEAKKGQKKSHFKLPLQSNTKARIISSMYVPGVPTSFKYRLTSIWQFFFAKISKF